MAARLAREQAMAELLKQFVPQAFSSNEYLSTEPGLIDEWKLSKVAPEGLISLIYLRHRGVNDGVRFWREFTDLFLRGSHSIDGFGLKQIENIAIGLGSGGGRKMVKKPGFIGRHITDRDWERKAEAENAEVVE